MLFVLQQQVSNA